MSRHEKTLAKLRAKPPAADLKWDALKSLLLHLGFELLNGSGSRRKFYHRARNLLIICHEPHPSPNVDKGCVADVAERLKQYGWIE